MTFKEILTRFAPLGSAMALAAVGVWFLVGEPESVTEGERFFGTALLSAGLILLGAWLATTVWEIHEGDRNRHRRRGGPRIPAEADDEGESEW